MRRVPAVFDEGWRKHMSLARIKNVAKETQQAFRALQLVRKMQNSRRLVLVVGHEMKMSGASLLLIHVVRNVAERGYTPVLLVNAGAPMSPEALALLPAETVLLQLWAGSSACRLFLKQLSDMGVTKCLANTVITGLFAGCLKEYGFEVTWLIHEMKGSCQILRAETIAKDICRYGKNLVFPNSTVLDSFLSFAQEQSQRCAVHILPQGIYKQLPSRRSNNRDNRSLLRKRLNLPEDAVILLGSGAINFGKGIDLLVSTLAHLKKNELPQLPPFHVIWLGTSDNHDSFTVWLRLEIEDAGLDDRWHWAGYVSDDETYCDYLCAADIFVLPSREDANPSAAMEAAAMGLPIAAFLGSGGGAELAQRQHGAVANAGCIEDYACLIQSLVTCSASLKKRLDTCAEEIACTGTFSNYVNAILRLMALK